ncbi:MAG: hypothetical protein WCD79_02090 [Chthoniobacteraceae bacterium]
MRTLLFLLMICATAAHAQTKLSAKEAKVVREFMTGRIPVFKVGPAGLRETIAALREEWARLYPGEKFPVAISKNATITGDELPFDLRDISFFHALKLIGGAWLCKIDIGSSSGALFTLKHSNADDYEVKVYPLTPKLLAALGLPRDSLPTQVQEALARAGIHWEKGMSAAFYKNRLVVKTSEDVMENIDSIYLMIDAGMKIEGTKF